NDADAVTFISTATAPADIYPLSLHDALPISIYQEWLNIGDKTFVELFESEEYSKQMAEVNALQLKLRKDIELQMEKFMVGVPVRSEEHTSELQSRENLVCRLLLEKKK